MAATPKEESMKFRVLGKNGKSIWVGTPTQIVKQMSTLDHAGAANYKEYMDNVQGRLASIGIDIEFEPRTPYRFLRALARNGLIIMEQAEGPAPKPV